MKKVKKYVPFDGPCPFLMCLETGPHVHPVCPECGSVRYGNMFCKECRKYANKVMGVNKLEKCKSD